MKKYSDNFDKVVSIMDTDKFLLSPQGCLDQIKRRFEKYYFTKTFSTKNFDYFFLSYHETY